MMDVVSNKSLTWHESGISIASVPRSAVLFSHTFIIYRPR